VQNDLTDDEKKRTSDSMATQVQDEINVLSEKMQALQEKYDKVKPKYTTGTPSDGSSNGSSSNDGNQ
jgi:hypothetical protein